MTITGLDRVKGLRPSPTEHQSKTKRGLDSRQGTGASGPLDYEASRKLEP